MPSKRFVRRNIKRATKRNTHRNAGHGHKWTSFEMTAVLGMICRNEHNTLSTTAFAAALNEALGCGHENDISTDDVGELLSRIQVDKKAAMAFVERQPRPQVLTRAKKRAFERSIPFDGSMMEWLLEGRKNWIVGDSRRTAQETKNAMPRGGIVTTPQPKVGREATVSGAGVVRATSRDPLRQGLPQKPLLGNAYASADGYSLSAGSHQNLSFGQAAQIYDGVNPPAESSGPSSKLDTYRPARLSTRPWNSSAAITGYDRNINITEASLASSPTPADFWTDSGRGFSRHGQQTPVHRPHHTDAGK